MRPVDGLSFGLIPVLLVLGAGMCYLTYRIFTVSGSVAKRVRALPGPTGRLLDVRVRVDEEDLYDALVLLNVGVLVGLFVALRIGRPRFFGMTLIAIVGVILLDVMIFATVAMSGPLTALGRRRDRVPPEGYGRLRILGVAIVLVVAVSALVLLEREMIAPRLRALLRTAVLPYIPRWIPVPRPQQLPYTVLVGLVAGITLLVGALIGGVVGYVAARFTGEDPLDTDGGGGPFLSTSTFIRSLTAPRFRVVFRDRRFTVSALLGSISVLLLLGRGFVYFLVVSLFFTSMVLHIYRTDRSRQSIGSNLALIAVGAGLLMAAQVLTVPFYARTLDTIYHVSLIDRITNVGSLAAVESTRYDDLPIFHTLGSIGVQLSGLAGRSFTGVLFAVLFPSALVGGFVAFRNFTGSPTLAILGAVLLAINPEFVDWGTQAHAQSLSFVFLAVFLVVLTKWVHDLRYTLVAGVLILAWVMTHHLSVFMSLVLLSVPVVAGTLWVLVLRPDDWGLIQRPVGHHTMLTAAVLVYWWFMGIIYVPINWITRYSPAASSGLPTEQFLIQVYSTPMELALASVPFVLNRLHFVFFVALAGYGLWSIVRPGGRMPNRTFPVVVLCFLAAAPLYVPNPTWIVARGIAVLNRWGIMTLPFLLLVPALALKRLGEDSVRTESVLSVALLVLVLSFVSIGAGFTDPSLADSAGFEKGARKYFTSEDLRAGEHVLEYTTDTSVSASHGFAAHLTRRSWSKTTADPPGRFHRIEVVDGRIVTRPGLTVIQSGTLQEKAIKVRLRPSQSSLYEGDVSILVPVSAEDVDLGLERRNVVYTSAGTIITFKPRVAESEGSASQSR